MARRRYHPATLAAPILLLLILLPSAFAFDSDFSFYPKNSQSCLNNASKTSKCSGDTAEEVNECLCGNGGNFITNAARCLGQNDKNDVQEVYNVMLEACTNSKTPMTVSQSEFLAAANGDDTASTTTQVSTSTAITSSTGTATAISTTTSSSSTATSTETNSGDKDNNGNDNDGGGLSKGAIIGIAVGAAAVGLIAIGASIFFFIKRRRNGPDDESHPMLRQSQYYDPSKPTTFPPTEPSPGYGHYSAEFKPGWTPSASPGYPPSDHRLSSGQYAGPYASPPQETAVPGQLYEMDGSTEPMRPVEMDGSQPLQHNSYNRPY